MKLGIVGGRKYNDWQQFCKVISSAVEFYGVTCIVSGGATGADALAKRYALENNLDYIEYRADWELYGKSAGYKRNHDIWDSSDMIIAFWDGESRGTKHTIDNYKGKLFVIRYE